MKKRLQRKSIIFSENIHICEETGGPHERPPPTPGTPVTTNLHPAARMKPGGGGASVDSPVSGRPPSPGSMLAHARNIGGWRVKVQGHVTARWGRARPRRGGGRVRWHLYDGC